MSAERVEEINIWIRIWGEGIGLPKTIWEDEEVQRELLDMKDWAHTWRALKSAVYNGGTQEAIDNINNPKYALELSVILDRYNK